MAEFLKLLSFVKLVLTDPTVEAELAQLNAALAQIFAGKVNPTSTTVTG